MVMETIKKIYTAIAAFFGSIAVDKLLHFICGMLIAAFFVIVVPPTASFAVVFAIVIGALKELFDHYVYKGWCWYDLLATALGGLVIQIMVWL